jgi:ADP-dependent NAD(P)H-hydrate dehydratase / NAD(P)H-hydrate epimerase
VNDFILTAAQMRSAEEALIAAGTSVDDLMQRAGHGAAEWVWRISGGRAVTVLCGPGNNGGDGWVIAEAIRARGGAVSVVMAAEPATPAAKLARGLYQGQVLPADVTVSGEVLVDCLFGTGLTRPLGADHLALLQGLAARHDKLVAVDLPSGVSSDDGALLNEGLPRNDLTIALGAWKWAHWMMPAAAQMGERKLVEIGIDASAQRDFITGTVLQQPSLSRPGPNAHKYSRGMLAIIVGDMPGAALLAARAATGSGAGYVKLLTDGHALSAPDDLVVDARLLDIALADPRISAILVGCGLGRSDIAKARLAEVVRGQSYAPIVLDGDALHLIADVGLPGPGRLTIMTPHAGELETLAKAYHLPAYHPPYARKVHQAIELHWNTDSVIVAKGPDTIVFDDDFGTAVAPSASTWLSTAGTGDVLAGIIAARLASGANCFEAACQGVWLHSEAARLTSPPFTAGQLAEAARSAFASCL